MEIEIELDGGEDQMDAIKEKFLGAAKMLKEAGMDPAEILSEQFMPDDMPSRAMEMGSSDMEEKKGMSGPKKAMMVAMLKKKMDM